MSAYRHALAIDESATAQDLARAARVLAGSGGVVLLNGRLALRPTPLAIHCAIIDPTPGAQRCDEEFKVMVENASRMLATSPLGSRLPRKPLHWSVVEDRGGSAAELWPVAGERSR